MRDAPRLRATVIGLLRFAAAEEEMLLSWPASASDEPGDPQNWAAAPLVAHNTEFKTQQVQRLVAVRHGDVPPQSGEVDHSSAQLYELCSRQPRGAVADASRRATDDLVDNLMEITDEDLVDPSRQPWLHGRQLWLQVIVRGFWHPTGHLGDYYLKHGQPQRAIGLQQQAIRTVDYLDAPDSARGMAHYNLGCAQATTERADEALATLTRAVELNPDLRANITRDSDLAHLRDSGRLEPLLR